MTIHRNRLAATLAGIALGGLTLLASAPMLAPFRCHRCRCQWASPARGRT